MRARGEKKEKGKESENGVFILPGCEAPPSPVMVSAPRKKCLLPFNDGEDGGQKGGEESTKRLHKRRREGRFSAAATAAPVAP